MPGNPLRYLRPHFAEHACPFLVHEPCGIVPELKLRVSRDIGPIGMAVSREMQTFRIGVAKAREFR